jgi:hypothetical protein
MRLYDNATCLSSTWHAAKGLLFLLCCQMLDRHGRQPSGIDYRSGNGAAFGGTPASVKVAPAGV